jgi:hypothetical protein
MSKKRFASVNGKPRTSEPTARTRAVRAFHNLSPQPNSMRRNVDDPQIMAIDHCTCR